ncbi:MAG: hypothetical protein AAB250_15390, partial [Bdellovibrionota bacterium]
FQYDLDLRPEDLVTIRRIIDSFDPANPGRNIVLEASDFEYWMRGHDTKLSNAKKLFQHAVDIERAWNTLEELGLREKLIAYGRLHDPNDSLAVLFDREPLRSTPVGTGRGKTAAQLKIDIVAHETDSPLALESITRSRKGWVNAFISRNGRKGEFAVHGEGFYTQIGTKGAAGTGLTIRFRLDPKAREGIDFLRANGDQSYVVVSNKRALHVVPESLDCELEDWFKVMKMLGPDNLGTMLRLDRRLQTKWELASSEERERIQREISRALRGVLARDPVARENAEFLDAWFKQPLTTNFSAEAVAFSHRYSEYQSELSFLASDHWRRHPRFPEIVDGILKGPDGKHAFAIHWFASMMKQPDVIARPEWFRWATTTNLDMRSAINLGEILESEAAARDPRWSSILDFHIDHGSSIMNAVSSSKSFSKAPNWERWMTRIFDRGPFVNEAGLLLLSDRARNDSRWHRWLKNYVDMTYEARDGMSPFVNQVLTSTSLRRDAKWLELARYILSLKENRRPPAPGAFDNGAHLGTDLTSAKTHLVFELLSEPELRNTDMVELALRNGDSHVARAVAWNIFQKGILNDRADLFLLWFKNTRDEKGRLPPETTGIFRRFAKHPAFAGVFPFRPTILVPLIASGWDLRDGKFQAPKRSKPFLPFMKRPATCPALFVR